jgi:MFS family permease
MTQPSVPFPPRRVAWYATGVLAVLQWLSVLDRFIISLLVGPIKHDLGITDVQFGIFNGFVFTATYALLGLGVGVLADSRSRRSLIFLGVAIWSLATAACGFAKEFWQLLIARMGVGAGEATMGPCASSMLADLFPRERLALAMATYNLGSMVGAGMAFVIGGQIVELVARTPHFALPLVGEMRSWQAVFFIIGVPGALLSLIVFTFPEPVRRGVRNVQVLRRSGLATYRELWRFIRSHGRFFLFHYLGFGLAMIVLTGCGAWYAPHLSRTFHWGPADTGLGIGLAIALGSITGSLMSTASVDALFRRGRRDAQMRWYMYSLLVATPVGICAMLTGNVWLFLVLLFFLLMLISALPSLAMSALNIVTPNELRGTGIALFALITGTLGAGTGPVIIAAVSDYIFKDEKAIGLAMAVVIGFCLPLAALFLRLGLGPMRKAVQEAEQWADTIAPDARHAFDPSLSTEHP